MPKDRKITVSYISNEMSKDLEKIIINALK